MKKKIDIIMAVIMLVSVFYVSFFHGSDTRNAQSVSVADSKIIVVDAGHGGVDPGKIGANGAKEKDINLIIAKKLAKKLTDNGYSVIMTREDDSGLYEEDDVNKKASDLKKRCEIADNGNASLMVSIHQNSFSGSEVKGSQVFYYTHSDEGKLIAQAIQSSLKRMVNPSNTRAAKTNDSYYLLIHTKCPTVIVECGFLSNPEEAYLLTDDEYQEKLAIAIFTGIDEYIKR